MQISPCDSHRETNRQIRKFFLWCRVLKHFSIEKPYNKKLNKGYNRRFKRKRGYKNV